MAGGALITGVTSAGPSSPEPPWTWATATSSPSPVAVAALTDREAQLEAACGVGEAGLRKVAKQLVDRKIADRPYLDLDGLTFAQRAAGEPHVWPRAWIVSGLALDHATTLSRIEAWRKSFHDLGERRCGVAIGYAPDGTEVVAAVALDALGDLAPLPVRARTGAWLTVDATLRVPATGARVLLLGPSGEPRSVPTSFEHGRVHARFATDRPGEFTVQVMAEVDTGPRPVLEARVFADVEPTTSLPNLTAPGEDAGGTGDAPTQLTNMIGKMREDARLPALARDPGLDALALTHARLMVKTRTVGHDLGDGDPAERLRDAGMSAREAGENVAHAPSVKLAHRTLYASPSHRANLVNGGFDRLGIAVIGDPDGSVWVTEVFASRLRHGAGP